MIAVADTEQVEDTIEAKGRNRLLGVRAHHWFGTEGDAETGEGEHGQIIGAITDGDHLLENEPFARRQFA